MGDAAGPEETGGSGNGSVDKLIDDDKRTRRDILAKRTDGADRDNVRDAGALQDIDIGTIVYVARGISMSATVTGKNGDRK